MINTINAQTPANSTPISCNHMNEATPVIAEIAVLTNRYFFMLVSILSRIYLNFFDWRLAGNIAVNFLLNVLCSTNMKIRYTNTMPNDVAMPATDAPMLAAIFVIFGIMFASKCKPTESDRYVPNWVSLSWIAGRALNNSENIGRIWVANKYMIMHTVASVPMYDVQSKIMDQIFECLSDGVLYGNARR